MQTAFIAAICTVLLELPAHAASPPGFSSDVAPILQKNCLACHSGAAKMGGLVMEKFDLLMKGGAHGPVIVPGKSGESRLVLMLEGKVQPRMPFGSDPLSARRHRDHQSMDRRGRHGPISRGRPRTSHRLRYRTSSPKFQWFRPSLSLQFSPDGKLLAVGRLSRSPAHRSSHEQTARHASGSCGLRTLHRLQPGWKNARRRRAGLPQRGGEIKIWDTAIAPASQDHAAAIGIAFIRWPGVRTGKLIASGSYDKMVKLWDVTSGKEVRNLQDHIDAVFAVAFSPDGKRLASASQDRTVKIWDVASGQRLYTLGDASDGLTSINYSPSGDRIAAAGYDKTIYVWRLGDSDSSLIQSLIADEDSILALVWTPNGKTIITSSSDGSIRFRDAATLDPLRVIDHQPDWVQALSISPDGTRLAAGRYNGSLTLYDTKAQSAPQGRTEGGH